MDFLGLTALTILDQTMKLLQETQGLGIDISRLPLDDPETFALLASGKTTECFQLESSGMQRYIRELGPTDIGDISAMIALYRPGPMEHIDTFIDAKHGRIPITYPHESLKELLDETYGVIVYQDQVLFILQQFAGYSLGEADTVRKAMGKKIASLMTQEREKFVQGALSQGFENDTATQIFDLHRALRRVCLQQGPQRQLRADLLLDRLLQDPPQRRVHGGGAERPRGQPGTGRHRHQRVLQARDSRAAARHQPFR